MAKLRHIAICVKDLEASAQFYEKIFEMTRAYEAKGRAIYLTDGNLRARYRHSVGQAELLTPNSVYELEIDLSVTSNVFLPGHALRLEISSSNFPRYGRNTNSGGAIAYDNESQVVVATNRVLHGPSYPSHLVLPVISR